jgi:UDP-N-acetylmuramoyl-L-alanyl-D-glutamate--2,6-diaminopimelate ligase
MEVSSHALDLHRADAIEFDCAVFTNLTQDHLDFHGTLERYFAAKRALYFPSRGAPPPSVAVVNVDDEWGGRLAGELRASGRSVATFGLGEDADYRAEGVEVSRSGSRFECRAPGGEVGVALPLSGVFNVYNALGALAACNALGVELDAAASALASAGQIPGRLEAIDEGQPFSVLVDYAHTPDSVANVLRAARQILESAGERDGRIVVVFGAGGDRDRDKRPLMGEAARRLADHVIVTSDNPRSEDPDEIIAAIVAGAEAVAGKGHAQGQEVAGGRKIPFDDRAVAREELRTGRSRPVA